MSSQDRLFVLTHRSFRSDRMIDSHPWFRLFLEFPSYQQKLHYNLTYLATLADKIILRTSKKEVSHF